MSAKATQILILAQEKDSSFYSCAIEADQSPPCEPVLLWDRIANRWPKERFPSFISHEAAAVGPHW
jgi:hypothetical protein